MKSSGKVQDWSGSWRATKRSKHGNGSRRKATVRRSPSSRTSSGYSAKFTLTDTRLLWSPCVASPHAAAPTQPHWSTRKSTRSWHCGGSRELATSTFSATMSRCSSCASTSGGFWDGIKKLWSRDCLPSSATDTEWTGALPSWSPCSMSIEHVECDWMSIGKILNRVSISLHMLHSSPMTDVFIASRDLRKFAPIFIST